MDDIDKLYEKCDILAKAGSNIAEHKEQYLEILEAVKGSSKEKRLASQFIARFFKHFPSLADKSLDAQLDLCEDQDVDIRKQAIKDLPSICKDSIEYLPKIADVLAQLLLTDDDSELTVVHLSLQRLFNLDAKGTLSGLFMQIVNGEEIVRERAIKFLCSRVKGATPEVLTKEVEEYLLLECKKVMQDVTGEEFTLLTSLLTSLKVAKTVPGQQALVDLVAEQAELDKDFEGSDSESISRLFLCVKQALNFFSPFVSAGHFIQHICLRVMPALETSSSLAAAAGEAPSEEVDVRLETLKLLAEMSPYATKMEEKVLEQCMLVVFNKLLEYLPLPPSEENAENSLGTPNLHLSHAECLVYTLHQLGRRHPQFLTQDAERLRDFKLRLQFLARGIQGYIKKLREALQNLKGDQLKTEENKLKVVALRTTSNLNTLIKDLFHVPPAYKSTIFLSWKTPVTQSTTATTTSPSSQTQKQSKEELTKTGTAVKASKRSPIVFEDDGTSKAKKMNKGEREIYMPPGGKYSAKVKQFPGFRGQGGDRGYGRGRSRGRFY